MVDNFSKKTDPTYRNFFSRNIGILSEKEQEILAQSRVAIAGLGGVGGAHALTLARMGVGHFHLADLDHFEPVNFNRQRGATISNLNRPKTKVITEMILEINPSAQIKTFDQGINPENIDNFLHSIDLAMDGIDAFAISPRRTLHQACHKKGIYAVASGPIGLTTTLHVFGPGSMSYEDYFDFKNCKTSDEEIIAFIIGTCPALLHIGQIDLKHVDFEKKQGPSLAAAVELCAGVACIEAMQILTKRGKPFLAPWYFQFDAGQKRIAKKYLLWGNRNPLQQYKRLIALSAYNKRR